MLIRLFSIRGALVLALTLGLLAPALPALADNPYGAIAISPSTLQVSSSWDFSSQDAADSRAIARCNALTNGANDCHPVVAVHAHLCGALAGDSNNGRTAGANGNTRQEAQNNALSALGSSNGQIIQWVCNTANANGNGNNGNGNNGNGNNGNANNANNSSSNNRYGAIAVSPSTMNSFGSWDLSNQNDANNQAISGCNARSNGNNDCVAAVRIHSQTCGTLAEDTSQNTWKDGHGNTRTDANNNALSRLGSSNGTVARSICNDNPANSTASSTNNNVAGIIGLVAGIAAIAALTHHRAAAPAATAAPAPAAVAPVAAAPVAVAPVAAVPVAAVAPPPVVAFGVQRYGSIAVNVRGTIATMASDRNTADASVADAISQCNAKSGGNYCTAHVTFSGTADQMCGAVAVLRKGQEISIGSATAGSESDAEARALMKAGTGSVILAHGCNTR